MRASRFGRVVCAAGFLLMTSSASAGTIAAARAAGPGRQVGIDAAVMTSFFDLVADVDHASFHIADATGGITVRGRVADVEALLSAVTEGDQITITSTTSQYQGLFELDLTAGPFEMTKTGSPGRPAPTVVTTVDFQDHSPTAEALESKLVRLNGVSFVQAGVFEGQTNYGVSDGIREVVIRVSTDEMDIVGEPIPAGTVDIIGIFGQYDSSAPYNDGYQLLVRSKSDITPAGTNFPPAAVGKDLWLNRGDAAVSILLLASDPDGEPQPLVYAIKGGYEAPIAVGPSRDFPFGGTLTDPNSTPPGRNVTAGGPLAGPRVVFTPDAQASGWFVLTFTASDGDDTNQAAVHLLIQDRGGPLITEIMYDPANANADAPGYEGDWEWIEVYNPTGSTYYLHTLYDSTLHGSYEANVWFEEVPAGQTRIIMHGSQTATFLAEWSALLQQAELIPLYCDGPYFENDRDAVLLFGSDDYEMYDDARLLDVVRYQSGQDGWPACNNRSSIFLERGRFTSIENDDGANWRLSFAGANGAVATPEDPCPPADSDEGSPSVLPPDPTQELTPPAAEDQAIEANLGGGTLQFTLSASTPGKDGAAFEITSTPRRCLIASGTGGSLTDPLNGGAPVSTGGVLAGNQVTWHPPSGASGVFAFGFRAHDAGGTSNYAYVTINVQDADRVVITEIMYNPRNQEDQDWEWIEVLNLTGLTIALDSLVTTASQQAGRIGNLGPAVIGPYQVKLIAPGDNESRTLAEFVAEWNPSADPGRLQVSQIIPVAPAKFPELAQTGRTLRLFADDGSLLDVVDYQNGQGGWPFSDDESSIFLRHLCVSTLDNDEGVKWLRSISGFENAYATPEAPGDPLDSDVGSPVLLPTAHNQAPEAVDSRVGVLMNTPTLIELHAEDDGLPEGSTLSYTITSIPAPEQGQLVDPGNGTPIMSAPYPLASDGHRVEYTPPAGFTSKLLTLDGNGDVTFKFSVSDGSPPSQFGATVTIVVQKGGLAISEIMYDPQNEDGKDWQWIEVCSTGDADAFLEILTDDDNENDGDTLVLATIPVGGIRVVTSGNNASRSRADFLAEWRPLSPAVVVFTRDDATWEVLANGGDRIQLIDDRSDLVDDVFYGAAGSWPTRDGTASIYVLDGHINAIDNDQPENWRPSTPGVDHAWSTPDIAGGGATDAHDVGSPGRRPGEPPSVTITAWRSVRSHARAGELSIVLNPLAAGSAVVSEPRRFGIQKIEVDFSANTSGSLTGTVQAENLTHGGTIAATNLSLINADRTLVIEFTPGLPDQACHRIDLAANVMGLIGDTNCLIRALQGDTTNDTRTDLTDMAQVKSLNRADPTAPGNARYDVNIDGKIDLTDMALVKSLNGGGPVACP